MSEFDQAVARTNTSSLKWDKYKGRDVLPFWVADMDFKVAEPIQQALEKRLAHPIYGYGTAPDELADVVIRHLEREFNWQVEPDWIVWLPGVVPGLAVSARAFCPDDHQIIVNPPIYHHFFDAHELKRQAILRVPLHQSGGRWTYDLAAIEAAIGPKTRLLMMCSPHNPTGTVFTADELRSLAELCESRDVIMVSDEIHCDLVIDSSVSHCPTAAACSAQSERIITLMSGSKTWNIAGLNCSFAIISNPQLREQFNRARQSIVPMVPPLAFEATLAAYRDGDPWRQRLLRYLEGNYRHLATALETLPGLQLEPLQATYLAWINAEELQLDDTQAFFESHGVGFSSGEQFGQPQYIRWNFACPRQTLEAGIERVRSALTELS